MEATEHAEANPKRRRIRELEVMVADTIADTHDTTTLVLFTGNDRLEYLPGHFCTIDPHNFPQLQRFTAFLEDQKGKKEPPRAYSLASAPHEKYLAITVKEEKYVSGTTKYPPLLSPLLVHRLPRGTRLMITGFTGPYVLPPDITTRTDHLVHVCAGSGIVPNYSIIKHCLVELPKIRHTLVYSNKTHDDIIFRRELDKLQRENPEQLNIVYTLTRDSAAKEQGTNFRSGRLNEALLKEFIPDPSAVEVFCCGPGITRFDREAARAKGEEPAPRFLESSLSALQAIGITNKQIHRESYG
ncbi:oxidoreductase [Anatilimnocola sp. NA78]|uniref:oxidoreductase n=1 Tax=Anatilimnocola sp. NA78 TaxID=3415683 RepID=UPI003CE461F8